MNWKLSLLSPSVAQLTALILSSKHELFIGWCFMKNTVEKLLIIA